MAGLKLYWEIPLYISITGIATFVLLAIYDIVVSGAVSETLCEDAAVSIAILMAMAIVIGIILELADEDDVQRDS